MPQHAAALCLQYGGEGDGIDRNEFGILLGNIDGFGLLGELDAKVLRLKLESVKSP
jgi:hypothetical protein